MGHHHLQLQPLTPLTAKETLAQIELLISPDTVCRPSSKRKSACGPACGLANPEPQTSTTNLPPPSQNTTDVKDVNWTANTLNLIDSSSARRSELNAVIRTFLLPGAEKELNIPSSMRERVLLDLQISTDPALLRPVADHVYQLLKNCSHRNFVRLGVSNGTYETVCMATGVGIALTIAGFLVSFLRAFVPFTGAHTRWEAFAAWPMWWLGVSLILSGLRGSCFFLLLFTRRQPLPWERFDDNASVLSSRTGLMRFFSRIMIFDRKVKVKDAHLRRLQYKIVLQSLVGGAIFASAGVLLFILLPVWQETVRL